MKTTDRREFVKTLAIGGVAAVAAPTLLGSLSKVAMASGVSESEGRPNFHFVVVSKTRNSHDFVALAGDGTLAGDAKNVEGGGLFTHFQPTPPKPFPIVGAGTWKAKKLRSFDLIGTYGSLAAGVLDMDVDLVRDVPSKLVIPATMRMVCNLGPAALNTGKGDEGVTLSVPSVGLEFEPQVPGVGVTVFGVDVVSEG